MSGDSPTNSLNLLHFLAPTDRRDVRDANLASLAPCLRLRESESRRASPCRTRLRNQTRPRDDANKSISPNVPAGPFSEPVRAGARARVVESLMAEDWMERFVAARTAEHEARLRRRQAEQAARDERHQAEALQRQLNLEEGARLREQREQPCGARTRAGPPCPRRGLGKGGRCANHGGKSTGPRTEAGKQRISAAQRARWMRWRRRRQRKPPSE